MAEMTPMMKQYLEIKNQYPDTILLFRLGDFYEMFFEDAKTASKELELVLTGRDCGQEERAPMCGVPYHSADPYIARLVAKGYKVAICEQAEDPATAKGIVRREVVRVLTPGTVIETNMLDESKNNYLACIYTYETSAGICFADVSTGNLHLTTLTGDKLELQIINEIGRYMPSEILLNSKALDYTQLATSLKKRINISAELMDDELFEFENCEQIVLKHFKKENLEQLGLNDEIHAVCAVGVTLQYLYDKQKTDLENIREIDFYRETQYMKLDLTARRNLELIETMRSREKKGSLLWVLDTTKTAMGKRLMRSWVEQPLRSCAQIIKRLNAVEELYSDSILRQDEMEHLSNIHDLERIMTRIVYGTANARELKSLAYTIKNLAPIRDRLKNVQTNMLQELYSSIDPLTDIHDLIEESIAEEPPFTVREGGLIRDGFHQELDNLRAIIKDGKGYIAGIEAKEQERTGIKKLKIGYNRVFGYYIEVLNTYKELVPEEYIRKQTLTNCERYITQELKDLEAKVLGAQERIVRIEYEIFNEIRQKVADELYRVQTTAQAVAKLDALCSLAQVAAANNYCRPDINDSSEIEIIDGRHPVVEKMLGGAPFVPNDTILDCKDNICAIITGPNMAGKSTYMRQVALIVLMAQIGSFVPAKSAVIGIVDSVFTRVGASDDLASGQSTFMVEMSEVAEILKNATSKSLIIFDEIGRGTSTFDGMSIARAVLEHAADSKKLGAKTLFATHYHELTELEGTMPGIKNYNIAVKKRGDDITFLRRIVRGGADGSYGIEVAKLAGVPNGVVKRARVILNELEEQEQNPRKPVPKVVLEYEDHEDFQLSLSDNGKFEIIDTLKMIDINTVTPIEALSMLHELSKKANEY